LASLFAYVGSKKFKPATQLDCRFRQSAESCCAECVKLIATWAQKDFQETGRRARGWLELFEPT